MLSVRVCESVRWVVGVHLEEAKEADEAEHAQEAQERERAAVGGRAAVHRLQVLDELDWHRRGRIDPEPAEEVVLSDDAAIGDPAGAAGLGDGRVERELLDVLRHLAHRLVQQPLVLVRESGHVVARLDRGRVPLADRVHLRARRVCCPVPVWFRAARGASPVAPRGSCVREGEPPAT